MKPGVAAPRTSPLAGAEQAIASWMVANVEAGMCKAKLHLTGVNMQEYLRKRAEREKHRLRLNKLLRSPELSGPEKHHAQCEYVLKYGKILCSCPECWLLPGLCICHRLNRFKPKSRVVVHIHHDEWGRGSNSGTLLPVCLEGAIKLVKGHKEHDALLHTIFNDPSTTAAVLWPGPTSLFPNELQELAAKHSQGHVTIVAVDGTWNNAMRMRASYPKDVIYVGLPASSSLKDQQPSSLLRPIRRYHGDAATNGRVSTLEAVAALLFELERDEDMHAGLLDNLRMKVDAMRLQTNRPTVYDTVAGARKELDDDPDEPPLSCT